MTATPTKKKLCWNCDGNVPLRAEHCPYCGVYIEQSVDVDEAEDQEEEDHAPPYTMSASKKAPAPPYSTAPKKLKAPQSEPKVARPAVTHAAVPKEQLRKVVLPLLLLICGSVFALFGLVLLLFSDNGVFVLKWNGDHWPFYLGTGIVFLAIGWRLVGNVEESST